MAKISGANSGVLYGDAATINAASGTTTITIDFTTAHGKLADDFINISSVVGMTDINGNHVVETVPDSDTITIVLSTATSQTYTSGGSARKTQCITGGTINQTAEVQNVTDSCSDGVNEYISNGYTDYTLDLEGFLDDTTNPIVLKTALSARLFLADGNEYFEGDVIVTSRPVVVAINGTDAVKISYTAQGTGVVTEPT